MALTAFCDPLIPREELFQKPPCMAIKISPDGKRLAYVGSDREGTMNIHVSSGHSLEGAEQVTDFKEPEIRSFYWLPDQQHILLLKDKNGTGQYRLYLVDLISKKMEDLTASYENVNAKIFRVSATENKAIIGLNVRDPRFHDIYAYDLSKNSLTLVYKNEGFINFLFDDDLNIVLKVGMNEDSSQTVMDKNDDVLFHLSAEDAFHTECLKFNPTENALYLIDNRNCDTTQLKKIDLGSKKEVVLGHDLRSDILDVYFEENRPIAYSTYYTHQEWHPLNNKMKSAIQYLTSKLGANFKIIDQSQNGQWWILKNSVPDRGVEFWIYNYSRRILKLLYSPKDRPLAKMYPLVIPSQDGYKLVSYLTLPRDMDGGGKPKQPLPLVVVPHGGPFKARDYYDYAAIHQWLANRGYAVLSVNFRLSSGFGKGFVNAGNGQWGKKAHQDLVDAVDWCIDSKIAIKEKVAILGGSYGGHAALSGLTFTPDVFACAVAICGPSNLKTVLDRVPFYWEICPASAPFSKLLFFTKNAFIKSMGGDPDKESDVPYLQSCSPLNYVDNIKKPLLLVHGANDPIVAASESQQIFAKMEQKKLPVIYLSYPDEGHGLLRIKNLLCFLGHAEWFLSQYLGGSYEPLSQTDLQASSAVIQSRSMPHEMEITSF
ncbi:MAG TPA: alpha/beta fold hydrolase [Chlamydiales bacterium]|nr:alpha/beta fold hydrolase [Chlamydiales bacterium]